MRALCGEKSFFHRYSPLILHYFLSKPRPGSLGLIKYMSIYIFSQLRSKPGRRSMQPNATSGFRVKFNHSLREHVLIVIESSQSLLGHSQTKWIGIAFLVKFQNSTCVLIMFQRASHSWTWVLRWRRSTQRSCMQSGNRISSVVWRVRLTEWRNRWYYTTSQSTQTTLKI